MINILKDSIKIQSYKDESKIGDYYVSILKSHGFTVLTQIVTGKRKNIFAIKNKNDKKRSILFYGHMDTVHPVEGFENPFEPRISGNKLYGLGSYDMKGGIAAFLSAAKDSNKYIKVFLAVGEEDISDGGWHAFNNNKSFFDDVSLVISAEPNFDLGLNGITTGRTGRVIFDLISIGKAVHIAKQSEGIDSIQKITEFIQKIYDPKIKKKFNSKKTVVQIRKIKGESVGMSVCSMCSAKIEVLLGPGDSVESTLKIFRSMIEDKNVTSVELAKRSTPYLEGYNFESFPYQEEISKIIKNFTKKDMKLHQRSSVGDDNIFGANGIPIITWGPDGANAHTNNEWVDIKSLNILQEMYKEFLLRFEE